MPASRPLIVCLLTALMCLVTAGQTQAQDERPTPDPEALAERCVGNMQDIAQLCGRRMTNISARTVNAIEDLLEEGEPRRAVILGREKVREINGLYHRCVDDIQDRARRCARVLDSLDAPELAEEVLRAARRITRGLNEVRAEAVGAIREALPEPPADGGA